MWVLNSRSSAAQSWVLRVCPILPGKNTFAWIYSPPISSNKTSSPAVRSPSSSLHLFPYQPDLVGKSFLRSNLLISKLFISACYWLQAINLLKILEDFHFYIKILEDFHFCRPMFCFQPVMLKSLALNDYNEDHITASFHVKWSWASKMNILVIKQKCLITIIFLVICPICII